MTDIYASTRKHAYMLTCLIPPDDSQKSHGSTPDFFSRVPIVELIMSVSQEGFVGAHETIVENHCGQYDAKEARRETTGRAVGVTFFRTCGEFSRSLLFLGSGTRLETFVPFMSVALFDATSLTNLANSLAGESFSPPKESRV